MLYSSPPDVGLAKGEALSASHVATKMPNDTEMALRIKLPQKYWIGINEWLVTYGQHLCKPVSPLCSDCRLRTECPRLGVTHSR